MSAHQAPQAAANTTAPVTVSTLQTMKERGEKIAMLTCYDASFAALMDNCGVDILLVGDSLGMVVSGFSSTLPVTMDHMVYHTQAVTRASKRSFVITDMPFGSYQQNPEHAYQNAVTLLAAGAHMIKIEGGEWLAPTVEFLTRRDIPVCAHIGLTPQSVHALGGYKVQGKTESAAVQLEKDALALQAAGAKIVLFEAIPQQLAKKVAQQLTVPTIGIGAGPDCGGQVLVMHDMLNVFPGKKAKFVRNFMENSHSIEEAIQKYVTDVKSGAFPGPEHCFNS